MVADFFYTTRTRVRSRYRPTPVGIHPSQTGWTTQQLLRPPVVVQTRPKEGCHTTVPRRLRWGRDVRTADNTVAVDARQVSAACLNVS